MASCHGLIGQIVQRRVTSDSAEELAVVRRCHTWLSAAEQLTTSWTAYEMTARVRFSSVVILFWSLLSTVLSRDVKASRSARPRGQIMWPRPRPHNGWPRPRPHSVVASASCILASWPRIFFCIMYDELCTVYLVTSSYSMQSALQITVYIAITVLPRFRQ